MSGASATRRPILDEARARVSERLRIVLGSIVAAAALVAPVGYLTSNPQALWTATAGGVVCAIVYLLDRFGHVEAGAHLLLFTMLVAVTLSMMHGEGIHDSGMILYPTIIVVGSLLLPTRTYIVLVGSVIASVAVVFWLSERGHIGARFRELTDIGDIVAVTTILLVQAIAVGLLASGLFRSLSDAHRENTDRRAAEEEVRRLNAELERRVEARTAELASVIEELEAFSYSVSHDLRTPLRVAGGYASILGQDYADKWEPAAQRLLERIQASNARMNLLIDELLAFSRLGRREVARQRVDMDSLVRHVVDTLTAAIPARDVEWTIAPLPPAWADPVLIEQVFQNVIGNALKYSSRRPRPHVEIGFDQSGGEASYFVRDNGVGFDMAMADKLFSVFERLHRDDEFEGSGVGLATVHRIVKKHGGRVWAHAKPDGGATFRFAIPPEQVAVAA